MTRAGRGILPGMVRRSIGWSVLMMAVALAGGCARGTDTVPRCEGLRCPERDAAGADGGEDGGGLDAGGVDGGSLDGGSLDAGPAPDGGTSPDGGTTCGGARCDLWMLPSGATRWTALSRGTTGFAPTTPVRAAFDVESLGRAWVLTDGTYHVMRLSDRAWIAGGERNALFPEASGAALRTGFSLPSPAAPHEIVFLNSATAAYSYEAQWSDGRMVFGSVTTTFGPEWSAAFAPARDQLRFDWVDLENTSGWASLDPRTLCDTTATTLTTYAVLGTGDAAHLLEGSSCFEFFRRDPHPTFGPLGFPDAPPVAAIGAAFMSAGTIYLLAE